MTMVFGSASKHNCAMRASWPRTHATELVGICSLGHAWLLAGIVTISFECSLYTSKSFKFGFYRKHLARRSPRMLDACSIQALGQDGQRGFLSVLKSTLVRFPSDIALRREAVKTSGSSQYARLLFPAALCNICITRNSIYQNTWPCACLPALWRRGGALQACPRGCHS